MIAFVAALVLVLPHTGVAVQSGGKVDLVRLDGRVVRTLPGATIVPAYHVPVGSVYVRDRAHALWRIHAGRMTRAGGVPRPRFSGGCFSTAAATRICGYPYGRGPSRIVLDGTVVPGTARAHGRWLMVDVSRRGRLLAQWSGECEIPSAYVGTRARLRAVVDPAIESLALGWAGERAVLAFPYGACGNGYDRPGVYVGTTWIHGLRPHGGDLAVLWR